MATVENPFSTDKPLDKEALCRFFKIETLLGPIDPSFRPLPYNYCKKHKLLPVSEKEDRILIALADPLDLQFRQKLNLVFSRPLEFCYCPEEKLLGLIETAFHQSDEATTELIEDLSNLDSASPKELESYDLLDDDKGSAPSIRLLNFILQEAINQRASDIHFEPIESNLRIRYRIDGVLQNRHTLSAKFHSNIITRLKVLSRLDIAEKRRPQDGRLELKLGKKEIQFRVSTILVTSGERIVLRILDSSSSKLGFEDLGMKSKILKPVSSMIQRSEGIFLVTGPTGSGKTTTLYSMLCEIAKDSLNIMTIEDPVEYQLPGIAQMGVQPKIGLTFASGLRHILRQDPDVIFIGEIRDLETAQIAIQAALTGHLVLSTLHTNDAPSSLARLVDMGIEPYLLSASLLGVLAQRLVRKICPECKDLDRPSREDLDALGIRAPKFDFYKGRGCSACHQTGYNGRVGIYELMQVKGEVKKKMSHSVDSTEIKEAALKEGWTPLRRCGLELIREGVTTLEEVVRVALGLSEE